MNKVQFPKYRRRQISDVVNITDIEKDTLPESMRFDLMRWQNTFANRCEEQLRSVQTQEGSFIEARLISKGEYMSIPTSYGQNVMYCENADDGTIRLQEHLLEPSSFTPVSCVSREATAIIERIDIGNLKSATEDALVLHLLRNGVTMDEMKSLYLRKPQWFTNELPAQWYAMLPRRGNLEVTSFSSNVLTRARSIFSRPKLHDAFTETINMQTEVPEN